LSTKRIRLSYTRLSAVLCCFSNIIPAHARPAWAGIVASLWVFSLGACAALTAPIPTPTLSPVESGREVYLRVCAECHGANGEGYANELAAPALDATEHAWHHPDQQIYDWIANGKLGLGRTMPALGDQLVHNEILAVIDYLHSLWTAEQLADQQSITERYPVTLAPRQEP